MVAMGKLSDEAVHQVVGPDSPGIYRNIPDRSVRVELLPAFVFLSRERPDRPIQCTSNHTHHPNFPSPRLSALGFVPGLPPGPQRRMSECNKPFLPLPPRVEQGGHGEKFRGPMVP